MNKFFLFSLSGFLCMSSFYAMHMPSIEKPIFRYIRMGEVDNVKYALEDDINIVSATNKDGDTPLLQAIVAMKNNDNTIVNMILEKTDIQTINHTDKRGMTALMLAVQYGDQNLCTLLIAKDADMEVATEGGWNALRIAIYNNNFNIVELLLKAKATCFSADIEWAKSEAVEENIISLLQKYCEEKKPEKINNDKDVIGSLTTLSHSLQGTARAMKKK